MTNEEQRIAELEAEVERLRTQKAEKPSLYVKFGNKRNVVVGGPALQQRFPVTLYAPGWLALLDHAEEIRAFIRENEAQLSWER